jgi:hypothetical protein
MTIRPTLVVIRHLQIGDRQFHHGDELPPDLLPQEAVDAHLDRKELDDSTERRSVYRLLHRFSGCSETERLTTDELIALTL